MTSSREDVRRLQERLGLSFNDQALLQQSLVHRSYLNENAGTRLESNERLEFLGDAVLGLIVADHLYRQHPNMSEGDLTDLRAALVRSVTLAEVSRNLGLGEYLLLGHGEAASGGRNRESLLAQAFEAVLGAVFLDQGIETTTNYCLGLISPLIPDILAQHLTKDPKSRLQEIAQGEVGETPAYLAVDESGPDHERDYTVAVCLGEIELARGQGRGKQVAAQAAAGAALLEWETLKVTTLRHLVERQQAQEQAVSKGRAFLSHPAVGRATKRKPRATRPRKIDSAPRKEQDAVAKRITDEEGESE